MVCQWETRQVAGYVGRRISFTLLLPLPTDNNNIWTYRCTLLHPHYAQANVPSRSDPTSHPLRSPSSPIPHSQRPKPNPALYDSNSNANAVLASTPFRQNLHCSQRRTTSLGSYPLSHRPYTRLRPPQLPLPSAAHLSIPCTQA